MPIIIVLCLRCLSRSEFDIKVVGIIRYVQALFVMLKFRSQTSTRKGVIKVYTDDFALIALSQQTAPYTSLLFLCGFFSFEHCEK